MTQHAIDILNRWVAETVRPVPPAEAAKEAARLATEFTAYAEDAGLGSSSSRSISAKTF